jgi:hypothetical protein
MLKRKFIHARGWRWWVRNFSHESLRRGRSEPQMYTRGVFEMLTWRFEHIIMYPISGKGKGRALFPAWKVVLPLLEGCCFWHARDPSNRERIFISSLRE